MNNLNSRVKLTFPSTLILDAKKKQPKTQTIVSCSRMLATSNRHPDSVSLVRGWDET